VRPIPFQAYRGSEPYIFVSYAHADGEQVFVELEALTRAGYRIWYDEGIDPGNEWPDEIARALNECSLFLVYVTPRSVESRNVRNEINFGLNHDKPFLAVHLEETALPIGLELRMGDIQAIMKWRMSDQAFRHKLRRALPDRLAGDIEAENVREWRPELPAQDEGVGTDLDMVRIQPGTFLRGSPSDELGRFDEPQHEVTLSYPFLVSRTQVTCGQWAQVTGTACVEDEARSELCPVADISFFDAIAFCNELSIQEGLGPSYSVTGDEVRWTREATGYRLLTEAEWECACRAGTWTAYYNGDDPARLHEIAWYAANSMGRTQPVGLKIPNAFGLYDMSGNVWEWVWDWIAPYPDEPVTDPIGPVEGTDRVLRGGSWRHQPPICRSAVRGRNLMIHRSHNVGFRIARFC